MNMNYDNYTDKAVALLSRLISTPSVSRDEKTAADIMENYISGMGFEAHREANNVWALISTKASPPSCSMHI